VRDFVALADQRLANQHLVDQSHVRFLLKNEIVARATFAVGTFKGVGFDLVKSVLVAAIAFT